MDEQVVVATFDVEVSASLLRQVLSLGVERKQIADTGQYRYECGLRQRLDLVEKPVDP